jgi:hypothetical protein
VTLLEELAGALLWFNPGIWLLLSQTRLVREQLVDAEAVRLTAAREPYIDALLAIARQRPVLDLAPAPLFLRRRHLTQRMHLLLKEASMSKLRLLSSYCSITAILAFAVWFGCLNFPLTGQPQIQQAEPASPQVDLPAATQEVQPPATPGKPSTPVPPPQMEGLSVTFRTPFTFDTPPAPMNRPIGQAVRLASAPIPADPNEPVIGGVQMPATPADRTAALALLEFARQNNQLRPPDTPPYILRATFNATGNSMDTGPGEIVETWVSEQSWKWTGSLGSYSVVRSRGYETAVGSKHPGSIPMRLHMVRNAIFWAVQPVDLSQEARTAAIRWNGMPATCILLSRTVAPEETRLWEEEEYCVDNASKLLQVQSPAPGTYVIYGYGGNSQFHGRSIPSRITIYVAGAMVVDAQVSIADAGPLDESLLQPTPEMIAGGPIDRGELPVRFPMEVRSASIFGTAKPVIVHASIDGGGNVLEEELSSAADPALAQTALDLVRKAKFAQSRTQRQHYINVRFVPASQ